jgi:hypothetical protein
LIVSGYAKAKTGARYRAHLAGTRGAERGTFFDIQLSKSSER